MIIKEIKTEGYYVYAHITPEKEVYIGTSKQQPYQRWSPSLYKGTALEPYIQRFGWKNIEHIVIQDGLTKEQALKLEDWFIANATRDGFCVNTRRSGLIEVSNKNAYMKKWHAEHREERNAYCRQWRNEHREEKKAYDKQWRDEHQEEIKAYQKQYNKQRRATTERKIYQRVLNYNRNHIPIETPLEAKQKYLDTGYIPTYIKHDDL